MIAIPDGDSERCDNLFQPVDDHDDEPQPVITTQQYFGVTDLPWTNMVVLVNLTWS